jgi:Phage portal protein
MKGQVYLLDSQSGVVIKINSPLLLQGLARPAEYQEIAKAVADPKSVGSKRLRDRYGITLDGVNCASRPFDFHLYAYATTLNTYHARAIRAKVKDIVGRKWKIAGDGAAGTKSQIEAFFRNGFGELTFGEGMGNVWTDYEALGNGYLEVVPTVKGEPAEMTHVPAPETWIRLDGLGFVQQKNGEYAHFRKWGLGDEKYAGLAPKDPLTAEGVTSIIHFSRYFPWSAFYGIPSIMPAWNRLALAVLESEYNLGFFANNAIPDYAVILEGEWEDDAEDTIRAYFKTHLKGQAHKTLALRTPAGSKITFEQLTSDNAKEGSFRLLRADCRDEILHAHGVPPQKVGIVETGRLGGNKANEQIEEYKISIVEPGREKVTARLNRLIETGFDAPEFTLAFEPYNTEDVAQNATVDGTYLDKKVLLPNEVRKNRFPDLEPLPGGDEPLDQGGAAAAVDAVGAMQKEIRAVIAPGGVD